MMASACDSSSIPALGLTESVCFFEPGNALARQIVDFNRDQPGRVVRRPNHHGDLRDVIQVRFQEPEQRRGLVMFGRGPTCSIRIPTGLRANLDQCYIDINPETGILMLCDTSRYHHTWLDQEKVVNPPRRAMVAYHTKSFKLQGASFDVLWPSFYQNAIPEYMSRLLALGKQLRDVVCTLDLMDVDTDLDDAPAAVPAAEPALRLLQRECSPCDLPMDEPHVKLEELGRGSYGVVSKAVVKRTGNFIAVKELKRCQSPEYLKREIEHMSNLKHVCLHQMHVCGC
jgi:hypothetical protein